MDKNFLEKKELFISYIPEHLHEYENYLSRFRENYFKKAEKHFWKVLYSLATLLALSQIPRDYMIFLSILIMIGMAIYLFIQWIKTNKYNKEYVKGWQDWHTKNLAEEYYKLEYDNEKMVLFGKNNSFDFNWKDIEILSYNKKILIFQNRKGESMLTLPTETLGESAFQELLQLAKCKIFYCYYLEY